MKNLIKVILISGVMVVASGCASKPQPDDPMVFSKTNVISTDGSVDTTFSPVTLSTDAAIAKFDADFRVECADIVSTLIISTQIRETIISNTDLDESAQVVRETFLGIALMKRAEAEKDIAQFKLAAISECNSQPNAYAAQETEARAATEKSVARSEMMTKTFTGIAKAAVALGLGALAFGSVTIASGGSLSYTH